MGFPYYVALIVAVCIAGLAVLVSCVENRHTVGVLLAFYVIAVLIITLFVRTYDLEVKTLLNPLAKYSQIGKSLAADGVKCFSKNRGMIMEIVLNILLFIPLGYLVPAVKDAFGKCWKILLLDQV